MVGVGEVSGVGVVDGVGEVSGVGVVDGVGEVSGVGVGDGSMVGVDGQSIEPAGIKPVSLKFNPPPVTSMRYVSPPGKQAPREPMGEYSSPEQTSPFCHEP